MPITLHIIDDDAAAHAITEGLEDLRARTTSNSDTVARPVVEQGLPSDLYFKDF
ncbi:hypothetical protein [Rathayibacter sp. VKM Ac-2927]|uniref:hypothetical protein n=1 Tax=Rathayibacter sp. VKM Ac-2927 TaxID=2929478 RepID=UPI001FB1C3FF|nr:hypothetical protein [Rathayibacter sp. VKM Ac-2927]MCJ1688525.1 hypothetical protein [Rathayibacter sp. VKM Ac-2927]